MQMIDAVLPQQTTAAEWIVLILQIAIPTSSRGSRRFGIAEPWVSSALSSAAQSLLIQFDVVPLEQIGQLGVFK
jgi:hypothetical protein